MNHPSKYEIVLSLCRLFSVESDMEDDHKDTLRNIAMDVAGIARDNTVQTGACEVANETGEWPYWGVCRDQINEGLLENEDNPERMAAMLLSFDRVTTLDTLKVLEAIAKVPRA